MLTERLQQSENQVLWTTVKKSYKERFVRELRRGRCILKNMVNWYKFVIHNSFKSSLITTVFTTSLEFSTFSGKTIFSGFLPFEGSAVHRKNDMKYCGTAP